jgi:hypothetical protein
MTISNPLLSLIKQVSYQVGGAHRIHEKKDRSAGALDNRTVLPVTAQKRETVTLYENTCPPARLKITLQFAFHFAKTPCGKTLHSATVRPLLPLECREAPR